MHALDILAIGIYFVVLIGIGLSVARRERGAGESESFLAADRNMNLVQTTASTAATDLGGGFSIAMGGLGFTLGISGSWLIAISGLSVIMVSFLMVPKVKRWADAARGLMHGIMVGEIQALEGAGRTAHDFAAGDGTGNSFETLRRRQRFARSSCGSSHRDP